LTPENRVGGDGTKAKARSVVGSAEAAPAPEPPAEGRSDPEPDPKTEFVIFLHDDACRRFGTVLGPDANEAHKNHFHLDMKKRRGPFCE
jgi:hypothetical protein